MKTLRAVAAGLLWMVASACDDKGPSSPPVADDAPSEETQEVPRVGDPYQGGMVTEVTNYFGECTLVSVALDAEWQCSDELLALYDERPSSDTVSPLETRMLSAQLDNSGCAGVANLLRASVTAQALANVDAQFRGELRRCRPRVEQFAIGGDGTTPCTLALPGPNGPPGELLAPTSSPAARETTSTNNQVEGVDEADIVKNDNQYVFVTSSRGVHVIDAWPAEETHEVALIAVPGRATRLFLHEHKLVVYTTASQAGRPLCTYGYDCRRSQAERGPTSLLVFDVAQPDQPKELARYAFSGGFSAACRIGSVVHTVVSDDVSVQPPPVPMPVAVSSLEDWSTQREAARAAATAAVAALPDDAFLPWVEQRTAEDQRIGERAGCTQGLVGQATRGGVSTSLVSIDLATLAAPVRTVVATRPGFIYASEQALYIATDVGTHSPYEADQETTIHKIRLDGNGSSYAGSVRVGGHILNQFSMDERQGVLRVATTRGHVPNPDASNSVFTLAERDDGLRIVGQLDGIAPTEDIRSVRFDGERAFIVTFKKTDPLFAIGLSDPSAPKVLGELKIPGFSTYMHPLDRDHLLAVGYDADDMGSFAYFNGLQVQIFDVADLSAPKLLHKVSVGTRGTSSDALTDHLAFTYFPSRGLLAMPLNICEGGGNGTYGADLTFSGLMVFDATVAGGIRERGRMPFAEPGKDSSACGAWWTNAQSLVKRSIFMDDFAIGISPAQYKVSALASLATPLQSLRLE